MNDQGIRVGVVGAGYWGPNLIRNCAELGMLDSVCDIDAAALESIRHAHPNVATMTDFQELLTRPIDAVMIAAPAQFHAPMCLRAIDAGKHVFVEKPLALNIAEGERIEAAASSAGVTVFVGHLLLYHPAVKKLRGLIAGGEIGEVWHLRSRRLSLGKLRNFESVWWSFAPHDIAVMLAIMGEEPRSAVAAQGYARDAVLCDAAYADFHFARGRSAHIEVCWLDPDKSARLDVFGTRGVLTLTDSRKGSSLALKPVTIAKSERGLPLAIRGEERNVEFERTEPLQAEILAFADSIRTGVRPQTDARQGIAVLRALTMADDAARRQVELQALA
jgi:UDP-2-acetamido-3-amino-2,3-dideoxy-glucuronate N-acetyltransferase